MEYPCLPGFAQKSYGLFKLILFGKQSHLTKKGDEARYQFVIRDGPKLQPGSYVDVVVRLVDEKGTTLNLALRHQGIQAVS